ncbi:hypothetical protein [Antarcticirhabdus aurantiaca]|uniref:Uncharacterized protein n=1 Tax=Antarcticirhabdus aurantiaca TaxID=2606717 RepID=A0ACD4NKD9_9HYPH|nr:hypothetical protein [Antarcticirhabdus aurantiaca]WAJ27278.1 hypothetical protein OXU80_20855 [Jeongeuplla avenae]
MADKERDPSKSPRRRREATFEALKMKVLLLEDWAKNGLPYQATYPRDQKALREWTGPNGTFATWKDPTIERSGEGGKYPDWGKRFLKAVDDLGKRGSERDAELRQAEADRDRYAAENRALRIQNADLIGQVDALERANRFLKGLASAREASRS